MINPIELCRGIISKRYPKTQLAKTLVPVLIFVFAIGIVSILKATKPEVKARPVLEKQWSVAVLEAKPSNISPRRRFYGEITAGREAELRSEVRGRVIEVNEKFIDGGVVSKGDLLVSFDPFDYAAEVSERDANLAEAKARLAELEADLEGAIVLLKRDKEQSSLRARDVARRFKINAKKKCFGKKS